MTLVSSADMVVSLPTSRVRAGERRRAQTRADLLAAGEALFGRRGLHGVTTHDIAREAGYAAGTFYLHFADKVELFREVAARAVRELRAAVDAAASEVDGTEEALRAHAAAMIDFAASRRDLVRILFSGESEAAAVERDVLDELAAGIAHDRSQRVARGEAPAGLDPAIYAQALVGMWSRVIAWWSADPSRAPREHVIETLVRIQLSGTWPRRR